RFMERGFLIGTVSAVVEAEVFVKPLRERDRQRIDTVELFFASSTNLVVRSVDRTIATRSAYVRAQTRLSLSDAIIVATALEDRCDALIGNDAAMRGRTPGLPYLYLGDYIIP
ncbi:MAG: PIN domain-containing protein, partial [Chloroflexi bacterium]|nr:PIN domain-containing protein [Chloroflexota bacterium]